MQRNKFIKSLIIFVLSIGFLLVLKSFFLELSNSYLTYTSNEFIQEYVNKKYIFEKEAIALIEDDIYLNINCIFYGTPEGDLQKSVKINSFQEFVLPIFILISFAISSCVYFKSKLIFLITSVIAGITIFTIKILIMIFDNYNYSEYLLSEFVFPIDQIIYLFNLVLNTTGSSINFVLPILILLFQFSLFNPKESILNQ